MEGINIYDQDRNERDVLTRKPLSFLIIGKPCVGKSTLAHRLSAVWKCQLVDATSTIEQAMRDGTPLGEEAKESLMKGEKLSNKLVANLITEKLATPEVKYYGYVLDCLPCASSQWKSVEDQIEYITGLANSPDVIINLRVPDSDLAKRRIGQMVDPMSGAVFIKRVYNPGQQQQQQAGKGKEREEDQEEEEEEDEDNEDDDDDDTDSQVDEFVDDLGEVDELQQLAPDISERLVVRPEDLPESVEQDMRYYRDYMLKPLEDCIIKHNQQLVIELDANLPPKELFRALLVRLTALGLPRAAAPKRLYSQEDEDADIDTGADSDHMIQQLLGLKCLSPKFRWRRSQWGSSCPVELSDGNIVQGKPEFAVGFLDKVYMLSSAEALAQFMYNPSPYLLEPNPRVPCKLCVLGTLASGKTSLTKSLAEHFNAVVIEMDKLIEPVLEKVLEEAVEEARTKAMEETISRLKAVQAAVQAHQDEDEEEGIQEEEGPPIDADHPEVLLAMKAAEERVHRNPPEPTPNMYMDAMTIAVAEAEGKRRRDETDGRRHGGWILDGFPMTREHWTAMIDNNLLPDSVLVLEDDSGGAEKETMLMKRFAAANDLPEPATWQQVKKKPEEMVGEQEEFKPPQAPVPPEVIQWKKQRADFDKLWSSLLAAVKGSSIEPIQLNCFKTQQEILNDALKKIDAMFAYPVAEVFDEEEELEDGADGGEENEEEEDDELSARRKKPWGHTSYFCPVALKKNGVLWPGNQELAARYRDKLYCFNSEEAKESFLADPLQYVADSNCPIQPPPPRIFLLGPHGSGKTTLGRQLSKKTGMYHVSFREYLQECVMPKLVRPPLVDREDWQEKEKSNEEEEEEKTGDSENDADAEEEKEEDENDDIREELSEREAELRQYLLHNEPLSEETIIELASQFWHQEPFRSSGFIMEGFPQTGEELRYLCSKGLFPDAAVTLQLEGDDIIKRLLPKKMEIWCKKRDKRVDKRTAARAKVLQKWKLDKEKRRHEIETHYEERKAEKAAEKAAMKANTGEEDEEEQGFIEEEADDDYEEYKEHLAEINAEEPPEEEEEDEEAEEDAKERMNTALFEKYDEQNEALTALQEVLTEQQIPVHNVAAGRRQHVVLYSIDKVMKRYCQDRAGLLTKCTTIDHLTAKRLLDHGYKQLSHMRLWCPVQLSEQCQQTVLPPPSRVQCYPVVYHHNIVYLSSSDARQQFTIDPDRYLLQEIPGLPVSIKLAVLGPPKSGKSTVAQRFADEYGCMKLSIGEAMRRVIEQFPDSKLTHQILSYLVVGQTVPDELSVLALERALLDVQCTTRGYVFDGWPLNKAHIDLLTKYHVLPVCIVELEVSDQEMLRRAEVDREGSKKQPYPVHDSASIMLIRGGHYRKHLDSVREWYQQQHDNWYGVDGERNKWFIWRQISDRALQTSRQIQLYLSRVTSGKAAPISGLCITPAEFKARLGEYGHYCPVSLTDSGELVDCSSQPTLQWSAEYHSNYYRLAGQEKLDSFLSDPECYTGPDAKPLPPVEKLPHRRTAMEVKAMFPKKYEISGYCPVTYVDGKKRYEALVLGAPEFSAEYKQKLFCFASEQSLEKFLRRPRVYDVSGLPVKLPPVKKQVSITSLPMLGYMEQSVATAIINSLTAVGGVKPKFPFIDPTKSALQYVALHLKAFNPNASLYSREKHKKKLNRFEEHCQLIGYLSQIMKSGYKEPEERTGEFEYRMTSFLSLDGIGMVPSTSVIAS